jgi:hypothetical protein
MRGMGQDVIRRRVGTYVVWWGLYRYEPWPSVTLTASCDAMAFRPTLGRGLTVPRAEVTCIYVEQHWLAPAARLEGTAGVTPRTFRFWRPRLASVLGDLAALGWPVDPLSRANTWP